MRALIWVIPCGALPHPRCHSSLRRFSFSSSFGDFSDPVVVGRFVQVDGHSVARQGVLLGFTSWWRVAHSSPPWSRSSRSGAVPGTGRRGTAICSSCPCQLLGWCGEGRGAAIVGRCRDAPRRFPRGGTLPDCRRRAAGGGGAPQRQSAGALLIDRSDDEVRLGQLLVFDPGRHSNQYGRGLSRNARRLSQCAGTRVLPLSLPPGLSTVEERGSSRALANRDEGARANPLRPGLAGGLTGRRLTDRPSAAELAPARVAGPDGQQSRRWCRFARPHSAGTDGRQPVRVSPHGSLATRAVTGRGGRLDRSARYPPRPAEARERRQLAVARTPRRMLKHAISPA